MCEAAGTPRQVPARVGGSRLGCATCGAAWLPGAASGAEAAGLYGEAYFRGGEGAPLGYRDYEDDADLVRAQARARLRAIAGREPPPGALLEVGCATGLLLDEARARGWTVGGVEISPWAAARAEARLGPGIVVRGALGEAEIPASAYDVAVADDVIEHLADPVAGLRALRRALRPGGLLALQTPALGGLLHRASGAGWFHFKADHPVLLTPEALGLALRRAGFAAVELRPAARRVDLAYAASRIGHWSRPAGEIAGAALRRLPGGRRPFPLPTGEVTAFARAT